MNDLKYSLNARGFIDLILPVNANLLPTFKLLSFFFCLPQKTC